MNDAVFWTIVTKPFEEGYRRLERQLALYYPDIPHIVYREEDIVEFSKDPLFSFALKETDAIGTGYPYITRLLGKTYKRVIHIDADVFLLQKADELFGDFDCACLEDLNIGVHVSTSQAFNEEWLDLTIKDRAKYIDGDQSCFNLVSHNGKHTFVALGKEKIYSCIPSYHAEKIERVGDVLMYEGKEIAVLHIAGRWRLPIKNLLVEKDDPYFPVNADVLAYFKEKFI